MELRWPKHLQSVRRSPDEAAKEAGWLRREVLEEAPSLQTCEFLFCVRIQERTVFPRNEFCI